MQIVTHLQPFQVFVRVRNCYPEQTIQDSPINIIDHQKVMFDHQQNQLHINFNTTNRTYTKSKEIQFQRIFTQTDDNETVFSNTLKENIQMIEKGYNVTVLCYGMTGSGKTHTMFGSKANTEKGLVYKAVSELFTRINQDNAQDQYQIKVSFFEIYNETIIDLLSSNKDQKLTIQETKSGEILIPGLVRNNVSSQNELVSLIDLAQSKRQLAPTNNNQHSSRSHAIVQIYLCTYVKQTQTKFEGKLILVDLAGSEKCYYYNQNALKRQHEGQNINKSLLTLGQCIMMLNKQINITKASDGTIFRNLSYIPYRNSKLTRILKQSLGGNSLTIFIACISNNPLTLEETENTLKYAQKACQLKSNIAQTFTLDYEQEDYKASCIQFKTPYSSTDRVLQDLGDSVEVQIDSNIINQFEHDIQETETKVKELSRNNNKLHDCLDCLYKIINSENQLLNFQSSQLFTNYEAQIAENMKTQRQLLIKLRLLYEGKENLTTPSKSQTHQFITYTERQSFLVSDFSSSSRAYPTHAMRCGKQPRVHRVMNKSELSNQSQKDVKNPQLNKCRRTNSSNFQQINHFQCQTERQIKLATKSFHNPIKRS